VQLNGGLRQNARKRVLMKAMIIGPHGTHEARVRDLSVCGARVSMERLPPRDGDIIFTRGSIFVAARVGWSTPREAGLEFYRKLDPAELDSAYHPVIQGELRLGPRLITTT